MHWALVTVAALALACLVPATTVPVRAQAAVDTRLQWITNGPVSVGAVLGQTLYVGGTFTRVARRDDGLGAVHGVGESDGAVRPHWPMVDGEVRDVVPDGVGGYFVSGRFSSIGGVARTGLARIDATGAVDPAFAPVIGSHSGAPPVLDNLVVQGGALYFAARCCERLVVNGANRAAIAAVDLVQGTTLPFAPATGEVNALLLVNNQLTALGWTVDVFDASGALVRSTSLPTGAAQTGVVAGNRLVLGGRFSRADGTYVTVIAVDATTGVLDPAWPPPLPNDGFVFSLVSSGSVVYAGGEFTLFQGSSRGNLAAIDLTSGTLAPWAPWADGPVDALASTGAGLVVGGNFLSIDGVRRERLAEVDTAGGVTAWQAATYPTAVHHLLVRQGEVIVGGRMALSGGAARTDYAAFDLAADSLLPWAPDTPSRAPIAMAADPAGIVIGTENDSNGQPQVTVVTPDTGAPNTPSPWPAPARLAGVDRGYAYVSAGLDVSRGVVRRTRISTGHADTSWAVAMRPAGIVDGVMYGVEPLTPPHAIAVDLATLDAAPWQAAVPEALGFAGVGSVAVDGATVYLSVNNYLRPLATAFDRVSGRAVDWPVPAPLDVSPPTLAVSNGALLRHHRGGRPGSAITVVSGTGALRTWPLPVSNIPAPIRGERTMFTTPTDVVVLGVERAFPTIHGIAVLPHLAARGPQALTWSNGGRDVNLSWTAARADALYTVEAGSSEGQTDIGVFPVGAATSIRVPVSGGPFHVRVREVGDPVAATNAVAVIGGCAAPPLPPVGLAAHIGAGAVTLSWHAPGFATVDGYRLEARLAGAAPWTVRLDLGTVTTFTVPSPPPAAYAVRVSAVNACGASGPSAEVLLDTGAATALPPAGGPVTVTVNASDVTLAWAPVAGAVDYRLEIGRARGRADIGTVPVSGVTVSAAAVPPGQYFVRVRAASAAGTGPPGPDALVIVP